MAKKYYKRKQARKPCVVARMLEIAELALKVFVLTVEFIPKLQAIFAPYAGKILISLFLCYYNC